MLGEREVVVRRERDRCDIWREVKKEEVCGERVWEGMCGEGRRDCVNRYMEGVFVMREMVCIWIERNR